MYRKPRTPEWLEQPKREHVDTDQAVQRVVDQVKKKHCSRYTPMHYCIWGELIIEGKHTVMDDAPDKNTMFTRASGGIQEEQQKERMLMISYQWTKH